MGVTSGFNYAKDYAQEAINKALNGGTWSEVNAALSDRAKKIKDLGLTEDKAGSDAVVYAEVSAIMAGKANSSAEKKSTKSTTEPAATESYNVNSVDDNGLYSVSTPGYDPSAYTTSSSSSVSGSTIAGYVVLGLIGIVILDRLMGGGRKE